LYSPNGMVETLLTGSSLAWRQPTAQNPMGND
jgi:hypothetical protein